MRPRTAQIICIPIFALLVLGASWDSTSISATTTSSTSSVSTATTLLPPVLDGLSLLPLPSTSAPSGAKVMTALRYRTWHQDLVTGMQAGALIQAAQAQQAALAQQAAQAAATQQANALRAAPVSTYTPPTAAPVQSGYVPSAPSPITSGTSSGAFTATWWRCVINPESGGNFNDTSGGYGILVSTWHSYGMSGVPGDYSQSAQAGVAMQIYDANGGFGPGAWNNAANCGKGG